MMSTECITLTIESGFTADEHYRTTFRSAQDAAVYIVLGNTVTPCAEGAHHFSDLGRFGDGWCSKCHIQAWSLRWVGTGIYGDQTTEWAAGEVARWRKAASEAGVVPLDPHLSRILADMRVEEAVGPMPAPKAEPPTEIVVAETHPDAPFKRVRRGTVPPMPLVGADWKPNQIKGNR